MFHAALGLMLSGPVGLPLPAAIPIAYLSSLVVNYVLQRVFVFAHAQAFAVGVGSQFVRYILVAALQYVLIVMLTALLPGPLGLAERVVYVAAVLLTPVLTFALLRAKVFHG